MYVLNVVERKPVKIQVILHFLRFTTCSPNRLDRSQSGPFTQLFSSANKCQRNAMEDDVLIQIRSHQRHFRSTQHHSQFAHLLWQLKCILSHENHQFNTK